MVPPKAAKFITAETADAAPSAMPPTIIRISGGSIPAVSQQVKKARRAYTGCAGGGKSALPAW